jgi:hypothetical protein
MRDMRGTLALARFLVDEGSGVKLEELSRCSGSTLGVVRVRRLGAEATGVVVSAGTLRGRPRRDVFCSTGSGSGSGVRASSPSLLLSGLAWGV